MNEEKTSASLQIVFRVQAVPSNAHPGAYLYRDKWDDWGKYCTQFYLTFVDENGTHHDIGNVKIGQIGLKPGSAKEASAQSGVRRPAILDEFNQLDDTFFSLGQEDDYYANLSALGDDVRQAILRSLRDVAFNPGIWERTKNEYVSSESLMRFVSTSTVEGQYRRMASGGARLTPYLFTYVPPKRMGDGEPPFRLKFNIVPESLPPTNVHTLIGRNGVGKTRLLDLMAKSLVAPDAQARQSGHFIWAEETTQPSFSNLVTVAFSAFDDVEILPEGKAKDCCVNYSHIGLHRSSENTKIGTRPKSPKGLAREFVASLSECQIGPRRRRWMQAISILQGDPVFHFADIGELILLDLASEDERSKVEKIFLRLSSGHKIVLLTITRIVEVVEEKTLVLLDEPEAHLHPPLLAAFVRALSQLLVDRNGVAIIATHSPVVLQEIPRSCAWILSRSLNEAKAERPSIETFGENVGILTREVFQLELSQSGFQKILNNAVESHHTYEAAVEEFGGQLGAEARAVMRALFIEKIPGGDSNTHV